VTTAPANDLLGTAMVDFATGRRSAVWLRVASGRRLTHNLAAYFAPVTARERALLDQVEEPVLDVGCGPARHARLLQARGRLCCSCCDRASSRQTVAMRTRPTPIARSAFAGFCFPPDVIVLAVRWYLRFALSYRDVQEPTDQQEPDYLSLPGLPFPRSAGVLRSCLPSPAL
jgi:hypothetical protein